ncbi:MAG: hypothetical protein E7397_05995 [Ruminococcaceae bacterium]|nr:hypothetical protein [Oscillospiraceae bacterium]
MRSELLNGIWSCRGKNRENQPISFPVQIPGTVHTGLCNQRELEEIYYGKKADEWMWIEEKEWTFSKTFSYQKGEDFQKAELEFSGLDTYCKVFFNEIPLGFCDDMHIGYCFDVTDSIKDGENQIRLEFLPPASQTADIDYGECEGVFSSDRIFVRRMQCTFGWDWVHRLVTMGIWKDVTLYTNRFVKIDCLQASLKGLTPYGANMELYLKGAHDKKFFPDAFSKREVHEVKSPMVTFGVKNPQGEVIHSHKRMFREEILREYITITDAQLWYPNGYGAQPLYTLSATVTDEQDNLLYEKTVSFGIRDIQILEIQDEKGSTEEALATEKFKEFVPTPMQENECYGFILLINGEKIMCKGANWVPADVFPGNVPTEKLENLIRIAKDGNINMLRLWGGGYFESDAFFDLCDRYGIMLQQDFLMGCGTYPFDADYLESHSDAARHFTEQFREECEQNIQRICSHPSIIWWNGDNENQMEITENTVNNSRRIAMEITDTVIKKYDTTRRFFSSSPWGGSYNNSPARGMFHATGYLDFYFSVISKTDMSDYEANFASGVARFSNETPVISGISSYSLRRFMDEEDMKPGKIEMMDYHTKNHPAPQYRDFHLIHHIDMAGEKLFGAYQSIEDRLYKMNLLGYEWVRVVMESYRRHQWFSSGNLFWMYNDCWPAIGWSMVDYFGVPKNGYYSMKRTSARLCTSFVKEGDKIRLYLSNNGVLDAEGVATVYRICADGGIVDKKEIPVSSKKNEVQILDETDAFCADGTQILVCDLGTDQGNDRCWYFGIKPSELKFASANVQAKRTEDGFLLKTDKLAFFVTVDAEVVLEDNCILMLPGEEKHIKAQPSQTAQTEEFKVNWLNRF